MRVPLIAAFSLFALAFGLALFGKWQERRRQRRLDAMAAPHGDVPHVGGLVR